MGNRSLILAVVVVLAAASLEAAVLYDFRQTARTDSTGPVAGEIEGKGVIDGDRSRVDFLRGNLYSKGSYIISIRGAQQILLVNPKRKSYAEIDLSAVANRLASGDLKITNLKTRVDKLPDHPTVSGFPTDHYRVETTYQITWTGGPLPLTQSVKTVVEKWTTNAFGDVAESFLDESALRTGDPAFDQLIEAETSKIKGLPLRQLTTVTAQGTGSLAQSSSRVSTPPTRTHVTEILLSNIRMESVPSATFEIPDDFRKAEHGDSAADETRVHVLSLEEARPQ
ncbi:MAG TPA: hypothetical protein VMS56_04185 [Thermoanaerobaculia bacterium]|nr:hypothetical protein [Thermoanaerobaculia bacterium]